MKKIFNKIKSVKRQTLVKNSFLLPILLVVFMSISHVVSWYDLGNPISWAIYLSVAIEIFALASVAAASIGVGRFSIWALFGLVTSIQIIGNIFFTYQDIRVTSPVFLTWVELIQPWFEDWSNTDHRRLLALIQGGTLPLMSLIALHYYIVFNDKEKQNLQLETQIEEEKKILEINPVPFPPDVLEKIYQDKTNIIDENVEEEIPVNPVQNEKLEETVEVNVPDEKVNVPDEKVNAEAPTESVEIEVPAEKPIEITNENINNDNIIVEKIKNIETDVIPSAQWAGGVNKNWQNPQIMPGVNN